MSEHNAHARPQLPSKEELALLPPDGGPNWNRLVFEKSPYLQQHAANPVDWFPWGPEAFEKARAEDKPVFLSVGYSTCHWCHVMERESFEDAEVGRLMSDAFVCIKVDREERPDIDHVYMTVCQAMTGSGGWPMTVIMTPEKKPFFAGTYFPKKGRYGRAGMVELVPHITALWKDDRKKMVETADYITRELAKLSGSFPGEKLTTATLDLGFEEYHDRFDPVNGGFGMRPKFPVPHNYSFLLRQGQRTGNGEAFAMVEKSLLVMRLGGVFDHVGMGFHRYATDEVWLLPHFEKMLYDQALCAIAYTEAYQVLKNPFFRQVAEEIFTYIRRDMTDVEGGFYSAEDADSEGEEGKFYTWSVDEVMEILGQEEGMLYAKTFGFEGDGNFREESTGQAMGVNIPHLKRDMEGMAKILRIDKTELEMRMEAAKAKLFAVRENRIHPFKDDKVLADWNGLMIVALAKGARAFDCRAWRDLATRAADFCLKTLRRPDGRLLKRYRQGEAGLPGHLEDYAFLSWGMLELYEATLTPRYLAASVELVELMVKHFHDEQVGGFFLTADDGEELLVRSKDVYDGAIPSGNSIAALVLIRLGRMLARPDFEELGRGTLAAFAGSLVRAPANFAQALIALDTSLRPPTEIVLVGALEDGGLQALRSVVDRHFLPGAVLVHIDPSAENKDLLRLAPGLKDYALVGGRSAAYVCQNFACQAPVTDPAALEVALKAIT